jgi:hypothetical protein
MHICKIAPASTLLHINAVVHDCCGLTKEHQDADIDERSFSSSWDFLGCGKLNIILWFCPEAALRTFEIVLLCVYNIQIQQLTILLEVMYMMESVHHNHPLSLLHVEVKFELCPLIAVLNTMTIFMNHFPTLILVDKALSWFNLVIKETCMSC